MRRLNAGAAVALCVAAVGCGSDDASSASPIACTGGANAFITALKGAPDAVLLDGQTPISECLPAEQGAGDLADVGQGIVGAATELNKQSQDDPGGQATVELGYLVGAVEQGSQTTAGIHQDLVRRLESAASFVPGGGDPDPAFEGAYEKGYAAGQETG
jgi:hypothetical protein